MNIPKVITFEVASDAANKVRDYMNKGISCRGVKWIDETFALAYILQEWKNSNDFIKEYKFINNAATYNYHRYEDIDY